MRGSSILLYCLLMAYLLASGLSVNASANGPNPFIILEDLPPDLVYFHDLPIEKGGERIMKLDLVCPKSPANPLPAPIYIHGGGWNHSGKNDHARKIIGYAKEGYIVNIEYRLTHEAISPVLEGY